MFKKYFSPFSFFFFSAIFLGIFSYFSPVQAAVPSPYFELSAAEGQGAGEDEFYVGRCFRVNIYLNTGGLNSNGADVEINYDNSAAQIVQSNCSSAADQIYTDGLFSAYPAVANVVTDSKILLSAYNNADVSTNVAHGLYGHFFVKVNSAQDPFQMQFQYTDGLTTDTNLAETDGDGLDILQSVIDLSLKLVTDSNDPDISNESPANAASGVSVSSNVTFRLFDTMSGIDSSAVSARMKKNGGSFSDQSVSLAAPATTNANRYYQYNATLNPNGEIKTNAGYYEYSTQYTVEVTESDLASPAHSTVHTWSFTTEGDTDAPYVTDKNPASGEVGVAVDAPISFRLKDYKGNGGVVPGLGVDTSSISVVVSSPGTGNHTYTCDSVGVTCDTSSGNENVLLTIVPSGPFAESETVTVYIDASDLASSANVMNQVVYTFSTADTIPPVVTNFLPEVNSFGNATSTNIRFHLTDAGAGVAIETLQVYVDDVLYTAESPELTITGDASDYGVVIDPASDFTDNRAVTVRISVRDQAPTLNYIDPNPTLLSFIVGLSDAEPPVCPKVSCRGGNVYIEKECPKVVEKVCPSQPLCEDKIIYVNVTNTVRESVYVPVPVYKSLACSNSDDADSSQNFLEPSYIADPNLDQSIILEKINEKKASEDMFFSFSENEEYLELVGVNHLNLDSIMAVLISPIEDSKDPLIFYTKVDSDGKFSSKIKNIFGPGNYRVATLRNPQAGDSQEQNLATLEITKEKKVSFFPVLKTQEQRSSGTSRVTLYVYLAIMVTSAMSLLFANFFVRSLGFGITLILSIIGFYIIQFYGGPTTLRTVTTTQTPLVNTKVQVTDPEKEKYLNLKSEKKQNIEKLKMKLVDPLTGKTFKNVVAYFGDQTALSNSSGEIFLTQLNTNDPIVVYFKEVGLMIDLPVEKAEVFEYKINPELAKILKKIEPDYAQRKFKSVYAFASGDFQKSQKVENFIETKNASLLKTLGRYRIMSQKFDPRVTMLSSWKSEKTQKTYAHVASVVLLSDVYNEKEGAQQLKETWYFVQENGTWKFLE